MIPRENVQSIEQYLVLIPNREEGLRQLFLAGFRRDSYRGVRVFFLLKEPIFFTVLFRVQVVKNVFSQVQIRSQQKMH